MRTSNPALSDNAFPASSYRYVSGGTDISAMTIQGVVIKTSILLLLALLSSTWVWVKFYSAGNNAAVITPWLYAGAFGGFIVAMVTVFKQQWAGFTAPIYAVLEGLFIGGLSAMMEASFPGIVIQATGLTFGTLFAMLFAYQSGLIKATEKFKLGVAAATGGIALLYIATMILGLFHVNVPFIYGSGWVGIAFSLFVVTIAALNFVLDFDMIEQGAQKGLPKYMEWYCSFALMVTLVWLYIEILRLLSKIREK